jgi:hypothetical protein
MHGHRNLKHVYITFFFGVREQASYSGLIFSQECTLFCIMLFCIVKMARSMDGVADLSVFTFLVPK